jgi:Na+/H+-dicarboxylate symporter
MTDSRKEIPLHIKMGVGFAVGLSTGLVAHFALADTAFLKNVIDYVTQPVGQIFIRLLFMLVIPLLFSALVMGVVEMGDIRSLGRVGWKTLAYTVLVSTIAVVIGIVLTNVIQPGAGMDSVMARGLLEESAGRTQSIVGGVKEQSGGLSLLVGIVPSNVFRAAADNDILAVMFFALMFGIGLVLTQGPGAEQVKRFVGGVFDVSMTLIHMVIRLAPYAVACLVFTLSAQFGWELLMRLGVYVLVVVLALSIHMVIVYSVVLRVAAKTSPIRFFKGIQEAIVMAFSTASSNATLPTALKVAEENLKLPRKVSRFVLTVGATANQNGTALFEGVTVLFLAQFFEVDLSLWQQIVVMLVCILGGIGTAGVPAGSLPVIAMICGMVGVPPEGIGIVLGVDRFLDMCRTTVNVTGDIVIAAAVSRGEEDNEDSADDVARGEVISS